MSRPSPNKHLMSHTLTKLKENLLYKLNVYLLCKMRRGCRSLSLLSKGSQSITAEVIKAHSPIGFVFYQVGHLPQRNLGSQYWYVAW